MRGQEQPIGAGSRVRSLLVVLDSDVGTGVNIGAGTVTCNYDGHDKHRTAIEDGAFVGTQQQLVAPVRIGRGAYVAAGSNRHPGCSGRRPGRRPGAPAQHRGMAGSETSTMSDPNPYGS